MALDAGLAYLHFLSIFGLFAVLSCEAILLRPRFIAQAGGWLYRVDIAYFVTAILVLASGLARATWGIKGWAYYAHNPLFHLKLGTFLVVGLISIVPTRLFIRWARGADGQVPAAELQRARRCVLIELHLLTLMPLFAVLMARGWRAWS